MDAGTAITLTASPQVSRVLTHSSLNLYSALTSFCSRWLLRQKQAVSKPDSRQKHEYPDAPTSACPQHSRAIPLLLQHFGAGADLIAYCRWHRHAKHCYDQDCQGPDGWWHTNEKHCRRKGCLDPNGDWHEHAKNCLAVSLPSAEPENLLQTSR